MRLEPFVRVDDTPFTASSKDVRQVWGAPVQSGRNEVGLDELDYGSVVFRFQDNGRLEEVTQRVDRLSLGSLVVPVALLARFVAAEDKTAFERAGFVISPRFGLAFDPSCPNWVTALAAHCIDTWRALETE